jgi:hypothetical protein
MGDEVYPGSGHGPYIQQGCAHGAVLQGTVVLVEGSKSKAGEEEKPPSPCRLIEADANILGEGVRASGYAICHPYG